MNTAPNTAKKKRMKSCHKGKKSYATFEEAKVAAEIISRKKARAKDPRVFVLNAYGCPCGKYHVGTTGEINWKLVNKTC